MKAIYLNVADRLEALRDGATSPIQLPDEITLSSEYSVARETLRRALKHLEMRGIVTRTPGVGTFLQPTFPRSSHLNGKTIGVVIPWWLNAGESWYVSVLRKGIERWAKEHSSHIEPIKGEKITLKSGDAKWFEEIRNKDLAGIIWIQPQESHLRRLELTSAVLPTVSIGRAVRNQSLYQVIPDYHQAAQLIDHYFHQTGNGAYAIVGKNAFDPISIAWREGFDKAHEERDSDFNHTHFIDYACFSEDMLGSLLLDFYKPSHSEVKAFFFTSSGSLHSALSDKRFRTKVESNLSVATMNIGYAKYPIEEIWENHDITRIDCDWTLLGERATNMLSMVAEGKSITKRMVEPVTLVQGDTVHNLKHLA